MIFKKIKKFCLKAALTITGTPKNAWMILFIACAVLAAGYLKTAIYSSKAQPVDLPVFRVQLESDATYTTGQPDETLPPDDAFTEYIKQREKSRDQQTGMLDELLSSKDTDQEIMAMAQKQKLDLASSIEAETAIEGLSYAIGIKNIVASVTPESVSIVVGEGELTQQLAVRLMDIAMRQTSLPSENIKIMEAGL